jgi:hypothetical protein
MLPRSTLSLLHRIAFIATLAAGLPDSCIAAEAPAVADAPAAAAADIIQTPVAESSAVRYGDSVATRYKVGAKIVAKGGTVRNIRIMVAVPLECPEQEVHVVEEDFSPHIESVEFRQLPDDKRAEPGARQMLITISQLPPRQEAHALITYEVVTRAILPPEDTASLKIPAKPDRQLKPYLSASPFINVNHRKIRDAVKESLAPSQESASTTETAADLTESDNAHAEPAAYDEIDQEGGKEAALGKAQEPKAESPAVFQTGEPDAASAAGASGDWQRVEAIYNFVTEKVKYEEGAQDKSALDALQDGKGDCHGISALFVAMCRTAKVPARMVWVDEHQYAEFYLEDAEGNGHWYPVQSAGTHSFGEMPTPKVILQKGDNFRVPERRRERLRYASDYTMLLAEPQFKPKVTYVREQL